MKDTLSAMPEDPCHEKLNFREQIDIFPPFPYMIIEIEKSIENIVRPPLAAYK